MTIKQKQNPHPFLGFPMKAHFQCRTRYVERQTKLTFTPVGNRVSRAPSLMCKGSISNLSLKRILGLITILAMLTS